MGRERPRKMEHFFLYLAYGILLLTSTQGCSHYKLQRQAYALFTEAAKDAAHGDYKKGLIKNEQALKKYSTIIGAQALYQRGLFYIHPKNPAQDFTEATRIFNELKKQFPSSKLNDDAEVWIVTLESIGQKNRLAAALQLKNADQKKTIWKLKRQEKSWKSRIKMLEEQIRSLENQIEKLKNIDLGVEMKKRKTTSR